jgi:endoglucanase
MGWGWALWNLHGSFGILDSERPGAVYEDFEGHKLDKRMLELLQKY